MNKLRDIDVQLRHGDDIFRRSWEGIANHLRSHAGL
jgi:hypothetical protein